MTSGCRGEVADLLIEAFDEWRSGSIDAQELMARVEDRLRELSHEEGRDGVLSAATLFDLSILAKDAYEVQYRMGNVSRIVSAMVLRLRNGDSGDVRGPQGPYGGDGEASEAVPVMGQGGDFREVLPLWGDTRPDRALVQGGQGRHALRGYGEQTVRGGRGDAEV